MTPRNIVRGVIPLNPVVSAWADSAVQTADGAFEMYAREGYLATFGEGDIYIAIQKSPYYTLCRPCSPCYPNAGDLESPDERGRETFCFGPAWFDPDECCPYPVFRVDNDEPVWGCDAEGSIWKGVLQGLAFTVSAYDEDDGEPDVEAGDVWGLIGDTERFLLISDVMNFHHEIKDMVLPWEEGGPDSDFWEKVGYNFHLTRNGHGAGFWDLGWEDAGDKLTELCEPYGTCELDVWVDGDGELRGDIHH